MAHVPEHHGPRRRRPRTMGGASRHTGAASRREPRACTCSMLGSCRWPNRSTRPSSTTPPTSSVRVAADTGNPFLEFEGRIARARAASMQGDAASADADVEALTELADGLRQPVLVARSHLNRAARAAANGRLGAAEEAACSRRCDARRIPRSCSSSRSSSPPCSVRATACRRRSRSSRRTSGPIPIAGSGVPLGPPTSLPSVASATPAPISRRSPRWISGR